MAHRRHRLLLRSLRNGSGTYLVIAGLLMSALAIDLGRERGPVMQEATDREQHGVVAADDVRDHAQEPRTIAAGEQFADAGDDIVGSVSKRSTKAWLKHRAKVAVARKASAATKKAKLEAMFRQDVIDRKAGKHALQGVASFYTFDTQTASGEKFNARAMVAAHRTLPFGTWIRVTDLDTEQSVTVRVNDRGPYVDGRIVDLTTAAAETLGITKRGLAKVKLDVIEVPATPVRVAQSAESRPASCMDENQMRPYTLALVTQRLYGMRTASN
jgi:rare lipoprotein A